MSAGLARRLQQLEEKYAQEFPRAVRLIWIDPEEDREREGKELPMSPAVPRESKRNSGCEETNAE